MAGVKEVENDRTGRPWPGASNVMNPIESETRACIACLERVLEIGARDHANYSPGAYYWAARRELERLRGNSPEKPEGSG